MQQAERAMQHLANDCFLKLAVNIEYKPDWQNDSIELLLKGALEEVAELCTELEKGDLREAQLECADVANFMMMLHDVIGLKIKNNQKK